MHPFSYPIWNLPILLHNQRDYEMSDFTNITHLTDGSNSNIFAAKLKGETVVIKKIKIEMKDDRVTRHEFDVEHGLLARIKHPNIITLYGAGYEGDRKFLVLQFLGGGSLRHLYDKVASEKKTAIFYSKKTFTFPETLWRARELACALNYLHHECCPEAHIVHRDLKPDNIAFTADGRLILFDLGLSTIIKRKSTDSDVFEMTGGTGSLRYMAPEVALRQPYNEKADVYSFAIIVWQMMSDQIPYDGASKASYLRYACKLGDRPDVFMSWPKDFKQLLVACWHQDHTQRPSFDRIISMLDSLLKKHPHKQ
jgi:serine/threonine protein kinase